jgi:hypothetical protein
LRNGRTKIRLEEEAISEILVADTDSETGAEASNVEDKFKKEEEEKKNSSSKPKQKMNHRLQQDVKDYQPGDHLKEGTQIFILSLDQQKA